ncbi:MAG: nicotinate-nucleotide adenylyltransferase [Lachnospiraceae bacterium]|nr:nicotinate-nucleotide adenylyltransferase [Lachnospiraceae bacterium]
MEGTTTRKIGIMGGTFDPIHIGHLILGESAYHQFDLDRVLFMPAGNPPHKKNREGRASLEERIEMVRLAIADNPHFELSLEEAGDKGYTYTRVTLERLHAQHPDTEYYFIMGADSLFDFEQWRDPDQIARLCTLVVSIRDHVSLSRFEAKIEELKQMYQADIRMLLTPNIDIASHTVREWISNSEPARYYLPDAVLRFIEERKLYQI